MVYHNLSFANLGDLSGRVALVTGGGTGIGNTIARGFAANGAKVYITGRRLEVLAKSAAVVDGVEPLQLDVNDKQSIRDAVEYVEKTDGKLDILVNNAGIVGPVSPFISDTNAPEHATLGKSLFESETWEQWMEIFSTNTIAPYFVSTAFLGLLEKGARSRPKQGETASIINISSALGSIKLSFNEFAYGMTKAALEKLTVTMATEFARQDVPVRVNAIAPGVFPSELNPPETVAKMTEPYAGAVAPTPLLRAGFEEEMVVVATYLASSAGGFTNGIVLRVDGGHNLVNP